MRHCVHGRHENWIYDNREPVDGRLGSLSGAHNSPSTKFIVRN